MKKAVIFSFSATGNTQKAVNLFKQSLEEKDIQTEIRKIDYKLNDFDTKDFDLVGFAYPIHGFNAPKIVLEVAKKLGKEDRKPCFILKTSGEPLKINNISSCKLASILKKKGFEITNEYHYAMPYNMIFRHTDNMASLMYDTMKRLIPCHADEVARGEKRLLEKVFLGSLLSAIFCIEFIAYKINGRFFKVDMEKCISCNKCVNICPRHNIEFKEGKFSFGKNCLGCTACSFSCPKDAFNIGMLQGWKVNGAYNFSASPERQKGKHERYCKKAYDKYFANAEKEISKFLEERDIKAV